MNRRNFIKHFGSIIASVAIAQKVIKSWMPAELTSEPLPFTLADLEKAREILLNSEPQTVTYEEFDNNGKIIQCTTKYWHPVTIEDWKKYKDA